MRSILLMLVVVPSLAAADATVPTPGGKTEHAVGAGLEWQGRCAARLERAKREAARREPIFARAVVQEVPVDEEMMAGGRPTHLEGVELRLDEVLLGRGEGTGTPSPEYFGAVVIRRAKQWQDISDVTATWTGDAPNGGNLSQMRQTHVLEGTITGFHFRVRGLALYRVVEAVIKPAVDDCLRLGGLE
jgi:hypothetical protein